MVSKGQFGSTKAKNCHDTGSSSLRVDAFGITDCGRSRPANEDHFLIRRLARPVRFRQSTSSRPSGQPDTTTPGYLFVVADGMGGHAGGANASHIAVEAIDAFFQHELSWLPAFERDDDQIGSLLKRAYEYADTRITDESNTHPQLAGMGTTLTTACVIGQRFILAHAGDCRAYLLRDGRLNQLTNDHTLSEELAANGAISHEEAERHTFRHVLTNAVGGNEPGVRTDVRMLPVKADDILLICSDGLTNMVDDETISAILDHEPDEERACQQLVDHANDSGGKDNITVVVARFSSISG